MQQEASRRKTFRFIAIGVGAVAAVFLFAWIASNFVGNDDPAPAPIDTIVTTQPIEVTGPPDTIAPDTIPIDTTPIDTTPTAGTQG